MATPPVHTPDRPHPTGTADPHTRPSAPPRIRLSRGVGTGPTTLAAFDDALVAAGLESFNLVPLSSVIPLGAQVSTVEPEGQLHGEHGDLLFCVLAAGYATTPAGQAWAGITWALRDDDSGAGLFVEHTSPTEPGLHAQLDATLGSMMRRRRDRYRPGGRLVSSAVCLDEPVAALVVASYQTLGWSVDADGRGDATGGQRVAR